MTVLAIFPPKIKATLTTLLHPDMTTATRANILAIMVIVMVRYAGCSDTKNQVNYNKLQAISKFTCWSAINWGIIALNILYLERAGWTRGAVNHDYTEVVKHERLERLMKGMKELDYQSQRSKELGSTYEDLLARCLAESHELEQKEVLDLQDLALRKMVANVADGHSFQGRIKVGNSLAVISGVINRAIRRRCSMECSPVMEGLSSISPHCMMVL